MKKVFFTVLLLLSAIGCNSGIVGVSGRVTVDGRPEPGVQLLFTRTEHGGPGGDSGIAMTDPEGRYRLTSLLDEKRGVEPGRYTVMFRWADEREAEMSNRYFVKEAIDGSMKFVVPESGTTTGDFDVSTSSKKPVLERP